MLWYLSDLSNIIYVMMFPLKADRLIKHRHKIHILESIISWGFPAVVVIAIVATQGYEIVSVPAICLPNMSLTLTTLFVPGVAFSLLTQTCFTILGTILYKRHVKSTLHTTNNEYLQRLRQIAVFSISFSILTLLIFVHYVCLVVGYREFNEYLADYWHCLTVFDKNNECCKPAHIAHYYPFTGFLSNVSFCTWGMVAVSALSVKEARSLWKRIFKSCFDKFNTSTHSRYRSRSLSVEQVSLGSIKQAS